MRYACLATAVALSACRGTADHRVSPEPSAASAAPFSSANAARSSDGELVPPLPADTDVRDVKVVRISRDNHYELDGKELGDASDIARSEKVRRLEPLSSALTQCRADFRANHPSDRFPGALILDVDESVSAAVVKAVFQTATFAGYPNVSFRVNKRP